MLELVVLLKEPLEKVLTAPSEEVIDAGESTALEAKQVQYLSMKINYLLMFYLTIEGKYYSEQGNRSGRKGFTFKDCAKQAMDAINEAHAGGIIHNAQTIMNWHQQFRVHHIFSLRTILSRAFFAWSFISG